MSSPPSSPPASVPPTRPISQAASVDQIEQALGALLRHVRSPRFAEAVRTRAGLDIDRAGYAVLVRVGELAPVRLSELAQYLGLDVSTVSRQVQQLEQRGLLARQSDPADGRAVQLELTPSGVIVTQRMRDGWCETVEEIIRDWNGDDVEQFGRLIARFVADLVQFLE